MIQVSANGYRATIQDEDACDPMRPEDPAKPDGPWVSPSPRKVTMVSIEGSNYDQKIKAPLTDLSAIFDALRGLREASLRQAKP